MKKLLVIFVSVIVLSGCFETDAKVAERNMRVAAENFELNRRIIFVNTWTDTWLQVIEGRCNIEYGSDRTSVICKTGPKESEFKRSFIGKSGQVTAMVEQLEGVPVNVYHYRRTFKPQSIIPDVDFRGDLKALKEVGTPDKTD